MNSIFSFNKYKNIYFLFFCHWTLHEQFSHCPKNALPAPGCSISPSSPIPPWLICLYQVAVNPWIKPHSLWSCLCVWGLWLAAQVLAFCYVKNLTCDDTKPFFDPHGPCNITKITNVTKEYNTSHTVQDGPKHLHSTTIFRSLHCTTSADIMTQHRHIARIKIWVGGWTFRGQLWDGCPLPT